MKSQLLIVLTIGAVFGALTTGCGSEEGGQTAPSAPVEPAATAERGNPPPIVDPSNAEPAHSPAQPKASPGTLSEQLSAEIEVPDYYPQDGPIYPGAKPNRSQQTANGRVTLMFAPETTPREASNVMSEAAEAKGWTIVLENEIERGYLTQAEKPGRKMTILTSAVGNGAGETTIVAVSVDP